MKNDIEKLWRALGVIMVTAVLSLLLLFIFTSCDDIYYPKKDITLSIDTNLPTDVNGYSYFELYSMDTQNIHTIAGTLRANGRIADPEREKVYWESSHYWTLHIGDTLATLYRRTWRGLGWQIVGDPITVINLKVAIIPTINPVSYNESDGSIHTVIAPMWEMRGDTMTIVAIAGNATEVKQIILK